MPQAIFTRLRLAALGACACLFLGIAGASAAQAATSTGVISPKNPSSDCDRSSSDVGSLDRQSFNACRAKEGVGPLVLPHNWGTLTQSEQEFVLIDLERVNRGLAPIVGLSSALNVLAATGAATNDDPAFPSHGMTGGGGLWGEASSPLGATYEWMYDDGPNGYNTNLDCPPGGGSGCWMHRDIILWKGGRARLVAGSASAGAGNHGSYAFEVVSGYSTAGLSFTWAHELRDFASKPEREPLGETAKSRPKRHRQKPHEKSREKSRKKSAKHSGSSSLATDSITITVG
jgi:hypothetical protein